jgi:tellurite resistance-related uncharacterized protein
MSGHTSFIRSLGEAISISNGEAMEILPTSVSHYNSSLEFDEKTVLMGLQRDRTTSAGVWATINVIEGQLDSCITEPSAEKHNLTPSIPGVIEPVQ